MLAVAAQPGLIAPVDLCIFCLRLGFDLGISIVKPLLHRFGVLLVGLFQRLLRRHAPALEIQAHRAYRHLHSEFLVNQIANRPAGPKRERHLELVRTLIANQLLNEFLLFRAQRPAFAFLSSLALGLERLRAFSSGSTHPLSYRVSMDFEQVSNLLLG